MQPIEAHENPDYSGYLGVPIQGGEYSEPLIGQTDFNYNRFNRMMSPTIYSPPKPACPDGIMRGWQERPKK